MGKVKSIKTKILVILIIFMLLFSYNGMTLAAIASSEEFEVISNGFFRKDEISFDAFFEDENGNRITDYSQNVNNKINLVFEISPQVKGFLRTGYIKAVQVKENSLEKDDLNFKFSRIVENTLNGISYDDFEEELIEEEKSLTEVVSTPVEAISSDTQTSLSDAVDSSMLENTSTGDAALEDLVIEDVIEETEEPEEFADEDVLVEEDEMIFDEEYKKVTIEDLIREAKLDIKIAADDEISLSNVIEDTRIVVELEFDKEENLKVSDLYKAIKLQLGGKFINQDLEEVKVGKEEEITVGWDYSADISVGTEFIKTSPFELGDIKGTIVESKVTLTRDIDDENYLPLKSSRLEIDVPKINDRFPTEVSVSANKLMATKGEDVGRVIFTEDNWKYNQGDGTIVISIENLENGIANYTFGMDEYLITYRFEDIAEGSSLNLESKVKAIVEEYSGKDGNTITKEISNHKDVVVNPDELISFNISSTEDIISKAEIYANYNSVDPVYETVFTNQVDIHILTSDVLDNLKVDLTKNVFKDKDGIEIDASGLVYKQIKFNYSEIKSLLQNGGEIQVLSKDNELLYTLSGSLIESEEDCIINLDNEEGIYLVAHNLAKNGLINLEITKAIIRPAIDKATFRNIKYLESRASAIVRYAEIDADLPLATIATTKEFSESMTRANITLNQKILSTTHLNENVEIKIELNNDKEDSDLYVKPSFEILFPKNINNVNIKNVNLISSDGLEIENYRTERQNDQTRLIVNLNGAQTEFSESQVTNGTNVIILADIEVDDYTPAKDDQIKLYYFNEAVSNYESQTKWSIERTLPNGVVKNTNGFDAVVIKYQAPSGMVPINGIVNFDGQLSEVKSVKEGMKTELIATNTSSRVITMEVLALNNTGEDCKDVVMLGRIPFKGNKNVVTGEDLGTTATGRMLDELKEDVNNLNTVAIYYSRKGEATKDLDNPENGWTEILDSFDEIRSFLIVVKGDMKAGTKLRYTYEYELPDNLPYESKIAGSFGIFYRIESETSNVDESSSADIVALETEKGPKLEVSLTGDVPTRSQIIAGKQLKFTAKVDNPGSVLATDVKVKVLVPDGMKYLMESAENVYTEIDDREVELPIGDIAPGESKEVKFMTKTINSSTTDHTYSYISVKVETTMTEKVIESEGLSYTIVDSYFDSQFTTGEIGDPVIGSQQRFYLYVYNNTIETLKNTIVEAHIGKNRKIVEIDTTCTNLGDEKLPEDKITIDEETGIVFFDLGDLKESSTFAFDIRAEVKEVKEGKIDSQAYCVFKADGVTEESTRIDLSIVKSLVTAKDISNVSETIKENEHFTVSTEIENTGAYRTNEAFVEYRFPEYVTIDKTLLSTGTKLNNTSSDGVTIIKLPLIDKGGILTVDTEFVGTNVAGSENHEAKIERKIKNEHQEDIDLAPISVIVLNSELTEQERREAEREENARQFEENKAKNNGGTTNNTQENPSNGNGSTNSQPSTNPSTNGTNTNNGRNGTNNNQTNGTNNATGTTETTNTSSIKYNISGIAWIDKNKDGIKDSDEALLKNIKVSLYNSDGSMVKSTITNSTGSYIFKEIPTGKYFVAFGIDQEKYIITSYKKDNGNLENVSRTIKIDEKLGAISEDIEIKDRNIININVGVILRSVFDLKVDKYISKIKVTNKKGTEEFKYDNKDIAKIEIPSRYIDGSEVEFTYTIDITNVGDIEGYVNNLVDYLPNGMTFDASKNPDWYKGENEIIYAKNIKDRLIKANDKITLQIVLDKKIDANNLGTISNKVAILDTYNNVNAEENKENNVSVQNTLVLVSTGGGTRIIWVVVVAAIIAAVVAINRERLLNIKIDFNKKYNNKEKTKDKKKTNILKRKYK